MTHGPSTGSTLINPQIVYADVTRQLRENLDAGVDVVMLRDYSDQLITGWFFIDERLGNVAMAAAFQFWKLRWRDDMIR